MRCAIYLRVSSKAQASDDELDDDAREGRQVSRERWGLRRQEQMCRDFARERGWTIVRVYKDIASGATIWQREALWDMLSAAERKEFDVVLVAELTRLSRDVNHQGLIYTQLEKHDVKLESVTDEIDETPMGQLIRSFMGAFAQFERQMTLARTRGGIEQRLKAGKLHPSCKPRFGYRWGDEKKSFYVIHEEEARIVRQIFDWYISGWGYHRILGELEKRCIPSPTKKKWYIRTIRAIIEDETYCGVARVKKTKVVKRGERKQQVRNEHPIILPNAAPALISREVWEAAQQARAHRQRERSRRYEHDTVLLRGHVYCPECHTKLHINTVGGKPRYTHNTEAWRTCQWRSIDCAKLDAAVWEAVKKRLVVNGDLARELRAYLERPTEAQTFSTVALIEEELERLRKRHQIAVERQLLLADDLSVEIAQKTIAALAEQVRSLEQDLEEARQREYEQATAKRRIEEILSMIEDVSPLLDHATLEVKIKILDALDVVVFVNKRGDTPRWYGWGRIVPNQPFAPLTNDTELVTTERSADRRFRYYQFATASRTPIVLDGSVVFPVAHGDVEPTLPTPTKITHPGCLRYLTESPLGKITSN